MSCRADSPHHCRLYSFYAPSRLFTAWAKLPNLPNSQFPEQDFLANHRWMVRSISSGLTAYARAFSSSAIHTSFRLQLPKFLLDKGRFITEPKKYLKKRIYWVFRTMLQNQLQLAILLRLWMNFHAGLTGREVVMSKFSSGDEFFKKIFFGE